MIEYSDNLISLVNWDSLGGGLMAKDAIMSVKEAEGQVKEIIKESEQNAIRSKEETIQYSEDESKRIINEAKESAKALQEEARREGEAASVPILENGSLDAEKIIGINEEKISLAVNIIIERIVNANGNS